MEKKISLNIACGNRTIESTEEFHWINIDSYERENPLDLIIDITKEFPFENNSVDYIYAEHFIEHLNWLEGKEFLQNCFNCLKKDGILRLVLPDYKKIFQKYLEKDYYFFKVFFQKLNNYDLSYYTKVYNEPEKIKKERKNNLPPEWHFTDRNRLKLRLRHYDYLIEIIDWFVHQYQEHKTLWDFESLEGLLKEIGFSRIIQTNWRKIDSKAPTRVKSSLYIEGIK